MNKITPYERKVFYYETDRMKVMHHSNYIRIFEEARLHYLGETGMPYDRIEDLGILIPVLSTDCTYKRPLTYNEPFAVYPKITGFNGTTLHISYRIISRATGELCAEGNSHHCFTDTDMKPLRTKLKYPEIYKILSDYNGYEIEE